MFTIRGKYAMIIPSQPCGKTRGRVGTGAASGRGKALPKRSLLRTTVRCFRRRRSKREAVPAPCLPHAAKAPFGVNKLGGVLVMAIVSQVIVYIMVIFMAIAALEIGRAHV